jgi:hypothetical protein
LVPNPAVDERHEALALAFLEAHDVRVDAEGDGHVGMPGVLGERRRVVPERVRLGQRALHLLRQQQAVKQGGRPRSAA